MYNEENRNELLLAIGEEFLAFLREWQKLNEEKEREKEEAIPPAPLFEEEKEIEKEASAVPLKCAREFFASLLSAPKTPRRKSMVPPSAEEVQQYLDSLHCTSFSGIEFVDHYQARGWQFDDYKPMRDWKACVRTWMRNRKDDWRDGRTPYRESSAARTEREFQERRQTMQDLIAGKLAGRR